MTLNEAHLTEATVEVWSVQSREAFESAVALGRLGTPGLLSTRGDFLPVNRVAYEWMATRLGKSLGTGRVKSLVWAWYRPTWTQCVRRDLSGYLPIDCREGVALRARVPSRQVLLSWFELWEYAYMGCTVPHRGAQGGPARRSPTWDVMFAGKLPPRLERIASTIQVTMPSIAVEDIVEVRRVVRWREDGASVERLRPKALKTR